MQIRFEFLEIPKTKRAKRVKPDSTKIDTEEEMMLDSELTLSAHREMDELAHVVEEMRCLSGLIARCFEPQLEVDEERNLLQRAPLSTLVPRGDDLESPLVRTLAERLSGSGRINRVRIRQHPKAAIEILGAWFQAHTDNPYPTKMEKLELVRNTGLNTRQWGRIVYLATHTDFTVGQLNIWLTNKRWRRSANPGNSDDEMLLAESKDNESVQEVGDQEEDDMLFSQTTDNTLSLTSQSSTGSSIVPVGEKELSLKRTSPGDEAVSLYKSSACKLGEAAIHILISGYIGRNLHGIGGIQVEKPPPSLPLASITPYTFCPGFKEVCISPNFPDPANSCISRSQWHVMHTFSRPYPMPSLYLGLKTSNHQA
jgi:hypothetical protein